MKSFHISDDVAHTEDTSKRPRGAEASDVEVISDEDRSGPQKRVKRVSANGVLGEAADTSGDRREPSTRTPVKNVNHKSEAAGRGAGSPAPLNAHESTEVTAQENLPRGGMEEDARGDLFMIPKRLSERHRGFLDATPDEWERRTVREPKCKLCPGVAFSKWEDFKRHCDFTEVHPLRISFCGYCGDFFARVDSLARHCKNRPPECLSATPEEAQEKRRETERVHADFKEKLGRCLRTEEVMETHFAQTIKEMFPGSSKRDTRKQSRLEAPKSES